MPADAPAAVPGVLLCPIAPEYKPGADTAVPGSGLVPAVALALARAAHARGCGVSIVGRDADADGRPVAPQRSTVCPAATHDVRDAALAEWANGHGWWFAYAPPADADAALTTAACALRATDAGGDLVVLAPHDLALGGACLRLLRAARARRGVRLVVLLVGRGTPRTPLASLPAAHVFRFDDWHLASGPDAADPPGALHHRRSAAFPRDAAR